MRSSHRVTVALLALTTIGAGSGLAQERWASDAWLEQPVDDATFATFLDFFAYDPGLPFELEVLSNTDIEGIRKEHISFQSTPGETVYANYYTASTSRPGARPHLIVVHGGLKSGKEYVSPIAEAAVRAGFDAIAIDMQYFGERDTGLLKSFNEADKHEHLYNRESTYLEWVIQLVKDVGRTFDLLVDHYDADPARIGYVGRSRGGQAGFIVVGAERRIAAAALLYAGHFDRSESGHLAAACPANYIGRIAPRPLWTLNGTLDGDYDRVLSVEPLLRHAPEPASLNWVETGHVSLRVEDGEAMFAWLADALQ